MDKNLDLTPAIPQIEESTLPTLALVNNEYIKAATSNNTRKAYRSDIKHYEQWGGRLPANPEQIVHYLQAFASSLNPRTLSRRLTALKNWHQYQQFPDPTIHPAIMKTLAGITRVHGKPKDKAYPLFPEDLLKITLTLKSDDGIAAVRDNALLQVGFFGAFRRSELVAICYEHIEWEQEGIQILIPHSKTDQLNEGQACVIPFGNESLCAVTALEKWVTLAKITSGPIFRRIFPNGTLETKALTPLTVNHIIKRRAEEAKLPFAQDLSSHSLRRGLASSASRSGAGIPAIMRQGRWKNVNTVVEYIEASARFSENAVNSVMQRMKEKE